MKTRPCFMLTLLISVTLTLVPNSFAQIHRPIVKVVYFIPSDQKPNNNVVKQMRTVIKRTQQFFADEMERHGFDRKTFELETNEKGIVKVHQVKGKRNVKVYHQGEDVYEEIYEQLNSKQYAPEHIFFILTEEGKRPKYFRDCGAAGPRGNNLSPGGVVGIFSKCLGFQIAVHELGHAFGLYHDWRNNKYMMSYGANPDRLSYCAAEWLNAHRAFNTNQSDTNEPASVKMLPPTLADSPNAVRLRFEITDLDGIHQVQLIAETNLQNGYFGLIGCRELNGKSSGTVEFTAKLNPKTHYVKLQMIDVNGSFHPRWEDYRFPIDMNSLASVPEIVIIRDPNLEISIRTALELDPLAPLTDLAMRNLQKLDIEPSNVTYIRGIEYATNIRELRLPKGQIEDILPLRNLTKLRILDLSHNKISDVRSLTGLTNLEELHLVGNPIKNRKPLFALLRKNPDVKIYLKNDREPLPVTLSHFRAEHTDTGVILNWTTESEVDNAGFYIYRSQTKDSDFKVVNRTMIQGAGTTGERNEYTWIDTTAKPNTVYYYQIEDVSHAGERKRYVTVHLRGLVSASGKWITRWADLKPQD